MVKRFINLLTNIFTWLRRGQTVTPKTNPVKVNVGSGLFVAEGWINIDGSLSAFFSRFPIPVLKLIYRATGSKQWYSEEQYIEKLKKHIFVHHDLSYGLPFSNDMVECLFTSHLLEHLYKVDAVKLLSDAYRVLKKGGIIRVCIPDLRYVIKLYQAGRKEEALSYLFTDSKAESINNHRYMYDFEMLEALLKGVGFKNITHCSYRQGRTPDIDILDNRPEETLFVEAEK